MFKLFKSLLKDSQPGTTVIDKVWISKSAKWKACAEMLNLNKDCLFVAWFPETLSDIHFTLHLPQNSRNAAIAEHVHPSDITGRMVIFLEHHPLRAIEQSLFKKLGLKEVPVLSSLDEPFFAHFGGDRTIELMQKLGMKEDEIVSHSMITKSIQNAQSKLADQVKINQRVNSQQEWFAIHFKKI